MISRVSAPVIKAQRESSSSSQTSLSPSPEPALRRKCACGGGTGLSDEGGESRTKRLQRKRTSSWAHGHHSLAPPVVHDVLNSPGRPLDSGARAFMEPRFNYDFGRVRVHAGPLAAESAKAVGAQAYTVGQDVVFDEGRYEPSTTEGRRLLAHELSHVVQQTGASSRGDLKIGAANDSSEREADQAAEHVVNRGANDSPLQSIAPSPLKLAREEKDPADAGAPVDGGSEESNELTDQDAKDCTPLYLQKLCIYIEGGFNGDRSGVPDDDEWARLNKGCRDESGYDGTDVQLTDNDKQRLRNPTCSRSTRKDALAKARSARIADALKRSAKYGSFSEEFIRIAQDPFFQGSLVVAITGYVLLWIVPEPVFSKLAAALSTIAILSTGVFGISNIITLANAWGDLDNEAGNATSDDQIEAAAKKFGQRITAVEANLVVFLASLLAGKVLPTPTPKGLPPATDALASAKTSLAGTPEGGNVIQGPWGRARAVSQPGDLAPPAVEGNTALKIERAPLPKTDPAPLPQPKPANDVVPQPKPAPAPSPNAPPAPVTPVVPGPNDPDKKKKTPFVLLLPQQKEPHLQLYRNWLGTLQSDPNYDRGDPHQENIWHQALRIGGGDPIPAEVYERGHRLGLTGEAGEILIRKPNWSRTKSVPMEVDHVIELQVTPNAQRSYFNSLANLELLDRLSNGTAGPLLQGNIASERAKQEAADPSLKGQVLKFDDVKMDGGTPGERWNVAQLKSGQQLDTYEQAKEK
jgi:hypothetical protein